jgi:hypothetical protein
MLHGMQQHTQHTLSHDGCVPTHLQPTCAWERACKGLLSSNGQLLRLLLTKPAATEIRVLFGCLYLTLISQGSTIIDQSILKYRSLV